jgi:hypothetical protein
MGGTPDEELEARWRRNKKARKATGPFKGMPRPKGLRAPDLVDELVRLRTMWPDKRFDSCLDALFEHQIVERTTIINKQGEPEPSYRFTDKQGSLLDPLNQRRADERRKECAAQIQALREQGFSERQACKEVAAATGYPAASFAAAWEQMRILSRESKKQPAAKARKRPLG